MLRARQGFPCDTMQADSWAMLDAAPLRDTVRMPLQGFQLLFYGDSILETFRGTSRGGPCARCAGGPEVYAEHFGSKYRSEVLAISGAGPQHAADAQFFCTLHAERLTVW